MTEANHIPASVLELLAKANKAADEYESDQRACVELAASLAHVRKAEVALRSEKTRLDESWKVALRDARGVDSDQIRRVRLEAAAAAEGAEEQNRIANEIEDELLDRRFDSAARWKAHQEARKTAATAYWRGCVDAAVAQLIKSPEAAELLAALPMLAHSLNVRGAYASTQKAVDEAIARGLYGLIARPFIDASADQPAPQTPGDVAKALRVVPHHPDEGSPSDFDSASYRARRASAKKQAAAA